MSSRYELFNVIALDDEQHTQPEHDVDANDKYHSCTSGKLNGCGDKLFVNLNQVF
jgi:hypothetical protein